MRLRLGMLALLGWGAVGAHAQKKQPGCVRAVVEGEVSAGRGFEAVFAPGLKFLLEPIASGWIVRVLDANRPRGPHDYAELATPPYRSVTPLAIGTDFSFRAQDALGWNPRRFRYAAGPDEFRRLRELYGPATSGDANAANALAQLAAGQPEVELKIVDSRLVPGTGDQARMAAPVASHFGTTPHTVESVAGVGVSLLGRVTWIRFRAAFDLRPGVHAASGAREEGRPCPL
jgi:hypothetical protein